MELLTAPQLTITYAAFGSRHGAQPSIANRSYDPWPVGGSRFAAGRYTCGMAKIRKARVPPGANREDEEAVVGLRIIGGSLRGRKLVYSGDTRTRPMKDRVREAVFNLLGTWIKDSHAIDLFAGTGALGLEAISRGAAKGTFIERHLPTSNIIRQNAAALGVAERVEVVFGDAFRWTAAFQPVNDTSLTVFCSPPYDFYVDRQQEILDLISRWVELGPAGSQIVVEADERFDFRSLPRPDEWDVRTYPPAVVGVLELN